MYCLHLSFVIIVITACSLVYFTLCILLLVFFFSYFFLCVYNIDSVSQLVLSQLICFAIELLLNTYTLYVINFFFIFLKYGVERSLGENATEQGLHALVKLCLVETKIIG